MTRSTLLLLVPLLGALACSEAAELTDLPVQDAHLAPAAAAFAAHGQGAVTQHGTFTSPFPPNPEVPYAPVPAPCLGLGEPLQMSGTWSGTFHITVTPNGRFHLKERIDYSEVGIRLGDLSWRAGPGAFESIVANLPDTEDDFGEAAFTVKHQFNARYISQNGLADLKVSHSIKQLLGPDLELRHNEFVPFSAQCIGGGR